MRVFVNAKGVDVPDGATVMDAVRAATPAEADAVAQGARKVTDSRGLDTDASAVTFAGAIYRTIPARPSRDEEEVF